MGIHRSNVVRIAIAVVLAGLLLPSVSETGAASREDAERTARGFLGAFLEDEGEAARYSVGNLDEWRTLLHERLPGSGGVSGYQILAVKGSSKARKVTVRISRGQTTEIFYLDVDRDGKITRFYTVSEELGRMVDELREVTRKIADLELSAETYAEFEALMAEQQRVASRIKNLLWRHRQLTEAE